MLLQQGLNFDDAESRSYLIVIIVLALFLAGSLTGFILIPFKIKGEMMVHLFL